MSADATREFVDANVLVYERMREEFNRGHDMRTSVRLGFSRALSEGLSAKQTDAEFDAVLKGAIDSIHAASIT